MGNTRDVTTAQSAFVVHPKPKSKPLNISDGTKAKEKAENVNANLEQKGISVGAKNSMLNQDTSLDDKSDELAKAREGSSSLKIASPLVFDASSKDEGENTKIIGSSLPIPPRYKPLEVPCTSEYTPSNVDLSNEFNNEKKRVHEIAKKNLGKQPTLGADLDINADFEKLIDENGSFLLSSPRESDDLLSTSSGQSIIRQIKDMEVEQPLDVEVSENSNSAKKRGEMEGAEMSVTSSLKRKKKKN